MPYPLLVLSLWLHNLATVVMLGYYLLLDLVYLPYLSQKFSGGTIGTALDEISTRIRPWLSGSLLVFIVTGVYLMLGDEHYLGFGDLANAWSILMLVKHVLIIGLIGLGALLNLTLKRGLAVSVPVHNPHFEPLGRIKLISHTMAIAALLVLLLTVMAQAQ